VLRYAVVTKTIGLRTTRGYPSSLQVFYRAMHIAIVGRPSVCLRR